MNCSLTIVLRDDDGNGLTGKNVKLRWLEDNFLTDKYSAIEVAGSPGVYEIHVDEMPFTLYKLWVDNAEWKSFGGLSGRPFGNPLVTFPNKTELQTLSNSVNSSISALTTSLNNSVAALNSALNGKANLSGPNNFTGSINFSADTTFQGPLVADYADFETDATGYHFITNTRMTSYVASQLANFNPYVDSPNRVRVSAGVSDSNGKIYNTIKKGTDYLVNSGASEGKVCTVEVIGMGVVFPPHDYIIADPLSFVNYVNIIGQGQHIKILVKDVNINAKMTVENATLILGGEPTGGGSASSRIFQFMKFRNCKIYHYKNLTIKGGEVNNCTFISAAGKNVTFDKDGSNNYCDVIDTVFNVDPTFEGGASYGGAMDAKIISALKVITDPTTIISDQ